MNLTNKPFKQTENTLTYDDRNVDTHFPQRLDVLHGLPHSYVGQRAVSKPGLSVVVAVSSYWAPGKQITDRSWTDRSEGDGENVTI